MPLTIADLEAAFTTYFEEMARCEQSKCYWALLHMLVALPDICAALQSASGDAGDGGPYRAWCKDNFAGSYLSPDDRYGIRCALLHQGRTTAPGGRYLSYSFVQPSASGSVVHNWVTPGDRNITLDVGEMARDTKAAMRSWFQRLQLPGNKARLTYVERHLPHLARERPKRFLTPPPGIGIDTTFSSTSS
jgi:hypothetical protein